MTISRLTAQPAALAPAYLGTCATPAGGGGLPEATVSGVFTPQGPGPGQPTPADRGEGAVGVRFASPAPHDPVPTPERGIEDTVQRALVRMRDARIQAVPIAGPCGGGKTKRGLLLGQCYSCADWGPLGPHTRAPRIQWGDAPVCHDHVAVYGAHLVAERQLHDGCAL
jgi:hypothetical protein